MPKLYEYFGISVFFFANDHDPIHVHGRRERRECKAEIIIVDGHITEIRIVPSGRKRPLTASEQNDFETLVRVKAEDIVAKWIAFFVRHTEVSTEIITKKLK
jgi:hypothetical protein